MKKTVLACLACVSVSACGGCNLFDRGGNTEKGRFFVEPVNDFEEIQPMASGTKATYAVFDYELTDRYRTRPADMKDVDVTPIARGKLRAHHDNLLTFEALEPGTITVEFTSEADRDDVTDVFEIEAIEAERFELSHACDTNYYVAGLTNRINHTFYGEGTYAMGAGWYPMSWSPDSGATLNEELSSQTFVALDIAEDTEELTVRSDLGEGNEPLELEIVPLASVTGAVLIDAQTGERFSNYPSSPEGWRRLRVVPLDDRGQQSCAAVLPVRVTTDTPRACTLGFDGAESLDLDDGEFWVNFESRTCNLAIEVLAGIVVELVVEVLVESSSSSSGDDDDFFDD